MNNMENGGIWEPTLHYKQLQQLCTDLPGIVPVLINHYTELSSGFLTREVRFILEKCLTAEIVEFVHKVNFENPNTQPLFLTLSKVSAFLAEFNAELQRYFKAQSGALASCDNDHSEIWRIEVEDRSGRLRAKFKQHYELDGGFRFLRMIKKALDLESRLLMQPDKEIARGVLKRRYESSSVQSSVSSKGLSTAKLVRKDSERGELSTPSLRVSEILSSLKRMCLTEERARNLIGLLSDMCDNWLSLEQSVAAVNDCLVCRDLKQLDESSVDVLAQVRKTCESFGLFGPLDMQMRRLRLQSLVMTRQSDCVIRAGSTCAGKYVELTLRLMFAEFFANEYHEDRRPELHVALLNGLETQGFVNGEMSLGKLTEIEQTTSNFLEPVTCTWLDANSKSDPEDSGCAHLKIRFKCRPTIEASSSKGSKAAQPFALCVFFPSAAGEFVACLSKPVTFITNANQFVTASAAVHYYASRRPAVYPLSLGQPLPMTIDDLLSLIANYSMEETSHRLNETSLEYFREKLTTLASVEDSLVKFEDFVSKPLLDNSKSLWDFVHASFKFARDYGLAMFRDGLVFGFVTRERANEFLADVQRSNGIPTHQFALLRFAQTTGTVTVALGDRHEVPKPVTHFKSVSLAEFCFSALPFTATLVCADGTYVKPEKLNEYIPKESFIPGYVSLSREFSEFDLNESDLSGIESFLDD